MPRQPSLSSPSEQKHAFLSLRDTRDVAALLNYSYSGLIYLLYKLPDEKKYKVFEIPKKSGGTRTITAPYPALKLLQRRLAEILQNTYNPKPTVYGFVAGKNIIDNAKRHKKKKWVLNIDLEDFFPSINFGRVRGMFMAKPYYLHDSVATILAQICCFQNELPQGAPTSPIVSNMICSRMDSELQTLAWDCRCFYTRYADDITFSTTLSQFPIQIASVHSLLDIDIGEDLQKIIEGNGFGINRKKTRAFSWLQRQEVTGLTVNRYPNVRRKYIRQIRALLHAWDKHGLKAAELVHNERYGRKDMGFEENHSSFKKVVRGKIEFLGLVKGKKSRTYRSFKTEFNRLVLRDRGLPIIRSFGERDGEKKPRVYTEGKTDAAILNTAWQKLYPDLQCPFIIKPCNYASSVSQKGSQGGSDVLKNQLKNLSEDSQLISIGIFDRDDAGINAFNEINNFELDGANEWKLLVSRKAGCILLPIPSGREKYADNKNLCIEFYFPDEVLAARNSEGKGLSLSIRVGKKEIPVEQEPDVSARHPESRKIRDDGGKVIFAEQIVPLLEVSAFASFNALFDRVLVLISKLEILQEEVETVSEIARSKS